MKRYASGQSISGTEVHPIIRLYHRISLWKFHFLPWPGDLVDQDRDILEAFDEIERYKAEHEEAERKKQEAKSKSKR